MVAAALLSTGLSQEVEQQQQQPLTSDDYACVHPPYKVHLFSKSPLVIYITDFLTPSERAHMLNLAKDTFQHSSVTSNSSAALHNIRTSSSTTLPPSDPVISCIESRAASFQGAHTPPSHLEPIQLVRYAAGEHYHFHTDWFPSADHAPLAHGGQRVSSFFGYVGVGADTTGGGTNFPVLDVPDDDEAWCEFVDCDEEYERGVTFKPVEGNVVYWDNVGSDGEGDHRTLHAGLPVTAGWKVGMNIWTREGPLGEEIKGSGGR
ncbi:uncharacterized protein DNG_06299 [Cephalotrichum gorgonifer]|uniref:Fe2OG dioxygenase domain-containing protein n=1 Tax=Cephalotrichum gorgonifer TaxID=2041049 RepID=A0AAE8SWB5_9PEZI|nr:uncharacterized protein DNG_06299 [Cephalotrichum gorgonifer]